MFHKTKSSENHKTLEHWLFSYLIGANAIPTKKEEQIDCGNGKGAISCQGCKSTVTNAKNWCGGDCEWDHFLEECVTKHIFDFADGDDELDL